MVDPGHLVERAWRSDDELTRARRVRVVAAGKAAAAMARRAAELLGERLVGGLVVAPGAAEAIARLDCVIGGHPVPTEGSESAGRRALAMANAAGPGETLLVLISGGASALMAVPAGALRLSDKQRTTGRLLREGAEIHDLNAVRKHLSAIKGGQLATATEASCTTFAISDVVGDDLTAIASGPTVADPTTFAGALRVLAACGGTDAYPPAVVARLQEGRDGRVAETPKPGDPRLARSRARVIGSRHEAMAGAADAARARGYQVVVVRPPVVGEARVAAASHLAQAWPAAGQPLCVVSSGETTVRVTGTGRGGRNQELALAAVEPLAALGRPAMLASVGTDGVDGPTDAAGAIADDTTAARARQRGLPPPARFLDDNDSYAFFDALDDLVRTGATGTNVGDLQVLLVG